MPAVLGSSPVVTGQKKIFLTDLNQVKFASNNDSKDIMIPQ